MNMKSVSGSQLSATKRKLRLNVGNLPVLKIFGHDKTQERTADAVAIQARAFRFRYGRQEMGFRNFGS